MIHTCVCVSLQQTDPMPCVLLSALEKLPEPILVEVGILVL